MKKFKSLFLLAFIVIFSCALSVGVYAAGDVPVVEVDSCGEVSSFLRAICDDIYKKSGESFTFDSSSIGSGYHSNVYRLTGSNEDLCVKIFKPGFLRLTNGYKKEHEYYYDVTGEKYVENFLVRLRDPRLKNISLPVAAYKSPHFFANISRFGGAIQLSELIKDGKALDEKAAATIIRDILAGRELLHSARYSHNDLHSWNVVVRFEDGKYLGASIVDSGNVRKESGKIWGYIASVTGYRFLRYLNLLTLCKIWPYINLRTGYYDPEDLNCFIVDDKSDVFAAGVMAWELIFGSCPFAGCGLKKEEVSGAMLKLEESREWLRNNKDVSEDCKDLLLKLLAPTKSERISSEEALKHDFFKLKKLD